MYVLYDRLSMGHIDIQISSRSRSEMEKRGLK